VRASWLVVLVVAGCGDDRRHVADAGVIDGSTGLVTVRYAPRDGSSGGGVEVYFQNPDSTLILSTRTFADGTANAFMPDGGFVTVRTTDFELWTWGGVEPGDELVLGAPPVLGADRVVDVRVVADPEAETYWLHTSCGNVADITGAQHGPRQVNVYECSPGPVDLLVVTRRDNFSLAHFAYRAAVDVVRGGDLVLDAPLQPVLPSLIELTSVPSRFGYFYAHQELRGRDGGIVFDSSSFSTALIPSGQGVGMGQVAIPRPAEATLVTYVDDTNTNNTSSLLHLVEWGPASAPVVLPIDQRIVRSFVGEPMYLPESSAIGWGETSDGQLAEAAIVDVVFGVASRLRWHVIGPRAKPELIAMGSLRLPVLPDPELHPAPGEPMRTIALKSIVATGGYAAYRARLLGWIPGEPWPIAGLEGHAVWSELGPDLR